MKHRIRFCALLLAAVMLPALAFAYNGQTLYEHVLDQMESTWKAFGYSWQQPEETVMEGVACAQFTQEPMDNWPFRYQIEIRWNEDGSLYALNALGSRSKLADALETATATESYLTARAVISALGDTLSAQESQQLTQWFEEEALPYWRSGYATDAEPRMELAGGTLYARVAWGECEMPWTLQWQENQAY